MIVDTSALVALLRDEPDAETYSHAPGHGTDLQNFCGHLAGDVKLVVEPVTAAQAEVARRAYQGFGRGSGHAARLNLGDCFAYALARESGEPLLFKGVDFSHTDVEVAVDC